MNTNRLSFLLLGCGFYLTGCVNAPTSTPQQPNTQQAPAPEVLTSNMAPPVAMPTRPSLKQQTYVLEYQREKHSPKMKSVQLPAHTIRAGQSLSINGEAAGLTDILKTQLSELLTLKQLSLAPAENADYLLAINQLGITEKPQIDYQLSNGKILPSDALRREYATQNCSDLLAEVSMKLTHRASGDVVWFGKSSLDTASFSQNPLRYQLIQTQQITNAAKVKNYVEQQNTQTARIARFNKAQPKAPRYNVVNNYSALEKMAGACSLTEVSALTPELHYYLSSILLEKINVM